MTFYPLHSAVPPLPAPSLGTGDHYFACRMKHLPICQGIHKLSWHWCGLLLIQPHLLPGQQVWLFSKELYFLSQRIVVFEGHTKFWTVLPCCNNRYTILYNLTMARHTHTESPFLARIPLFVPLFQRWLKSIFLGWNSESRQHGNTWKAFMN